jgi:hypothetical protein
VFTLDLLHPRCDDVVQARVCETIQQEALERIDASVRRVTATIGGCQITKGLDVPKRDAAAGERVRWRRREKKRDARTEADTDQRRRRAVVTLVGPEERPAQEPASPTVLLQSRADRGAAVGYDADRGVAFGSDDPETSDKRSQNVGSLAESDLRAIDERAADAHV